MKTFSSRQGPHINCLHLSQLNFELFTYDTSNLRRTFVKTLFVTKSEHNELEKLLNYTNKDDLMNFMIGKPGYSQHDDDQFKSYDDLVAGADTMVKK